MKCGKPKHLLFYRQRIISIGESFAFAKHTEYAKHSFFKHPFLDAGQSSIRSSSFRDYFLLKNI
ncbi:hypothetical protein ACFLV7_11730 [Chloroflexota bacterium]